MNREQARNIITNTFENPFDKDKFIKFITNLLKTYDRNKALFPRYGIQGVTERYLNFIKGWERIGVYENGGKRVDILIVELQKDISLYRARSTQRNFVAEYLQGKLGTGTKKDAALVAFISPDLEDWRFSLVKIDYRFEGTKVKEEFTPAKRWSFLVGKNEKSHTAQSRFVPILENDDWKPTLEDLEEAFNVEAVTEEFFEAYRYAINEVIIKSLDKQIEYRKLHSFAQQLLSRILFIYFLQRKRWLKWKDYEQDPHYIKNLWLKYKAYLKKNKNKKDTFYSSWLSSLFFGAFNKKSHLIDKELPEEIQESFKIMPFLNGGLFSKTELDDLALDVPDRVFEWLFEPDMNDKKKGFLEIFNFTIDESLPLDVEVAVDPEMLGKVYESLIAEEERGKSGIFYTPRVEIDFMCRMSLVEYLANETKIDKEKIVDLIFGQHNKISLFSKEELKEIKNKLERIKIVDPAVGSASFLVSMLNILVEIQSMLTKEIEGREENLFALKQRIIQENLYGVDVKDWACMVGELRLWLSLIIETEEKYMDIYTKPLLPNLSFKIRQGDTLVEEIGGVLISLRGEASRYMPKAVETKIRELIDRKNAFFSGQRSADLKEIKEIEKLEQTVFKKILTSKIEDLSKQIEKLEKEKKQLEGKKDIFGKEDEKAKEEIKNIEANIKVIIKEKENYETALRNLNDKKQKDYFLWEVDFAEIFAEKGGFDIVIGNPPYVRQELIAPPLENQSNYKPEDWRNLKNLYKDKLISSVQSIWKDVRKIDRKSDLYVYFYFHGLSLLKNGGLFCFINSNSWLDVGYGAGLQEFLLKNMRPIYIIDNLKKRSFKQADVNTVIVLIQRPVVGAYCNTPLQDDYTIKFVAFKKPFEDVINAEVIKRIEKGNQPVFDDEDFRLFPKTKKELLLEGVERDEEEGGLDFKLEPEHLPYIGNKWGGKYLRAPEIYFKILEKGKVGAHRNTPLLVRLGDIAEVEGYIHGFNVGRNFKKAYFIESIAQAQEIILTEHSEGVTFYGVKEKGNSRLIGDILIPRMIGDRFLSLINEGNVLGQKFYKIILKNKEQKISVGCFLNSTVCFLFMEITLLSLWGLGAISANSQDIKQIRVLILPELNKKLTILNRKIHSIFTELGFDPKKPIREQEPNPLPDRKALDDIVFDALGLTEEERKEVYWAVAELVKNRLEKARSL